MPQLAPAVLAALISTALLLAVHAYVYALYRERCVGIWAVSWAAFLVHTLIVMASVVFGEPPALTALNQVSLVAGAWLLAWGAFEFVGRKLPRVWTVLGALCLPWAVGASFLGLEHVVVSIPGSVFVGVAYIAVGWTILRHRVFASAGRIFVGLALVLWGCHKLDYPLLRDVEWFAPWGFALASTFTMATGIGMLLVYFERVRHALVEANGRFRRLVDDAADLAFLLDVATGRFVLVNRTAGEALGYADGELHDQPFERVSLGYTSAGIAQVFAQLGEQRVFTLEDRLRARDGRTFPVEIRVSRVADAERPLALAFARDVRERWHAQAERSIVSEVAKTFLQAASLDEVYRTVPRILANHLRYPISSVVIHDRTRDELLWAGCHGFGAFVPVGTRVPMGEAIASEVIRTGRPLALADATEHPDYKAPALRRFGLKAFAGAPFRLRGVIVGALTLADNQERDDVAETAATLALVADYLGQELDRRRMETALGRELEIDAALAGLSRALLAPGVDARRSAALVLAEALRLTGSARGCVVWHAPVPEAAGAGAGAGAGGGAGGGGGGESEGDPALAGWCAALPADRVLHGGAEPAPDEPPGRPPALARFLAVPVRSEAGLLARIVVADAAEAYAARDRRAVEQLAEVLALALHRRLAEEERQALQQQVWEAQKLQGLGTLAGGIAHDFNNILSAVMGFAELSTDLAADDPELLSNLEEIGGACRRAADLVRQILTFGRRTLEERQLLQPQVVVKETLQLLRTSLPPAVRLEREIEESTGPVFAHPAQLQQIVMNLCTNAFHAMRVGGGTLRVRLRAVPVVPGTAGAPAELAPGRHIVLTVSDTGEGMSEETRARIFEPYFTTKRLGEGTGLGLSVVHGIVTSLEGAVTVESAPGAGATFRVWLPEQEPVASEPQPALPPIAPAGSGRVLLVDDEQTVLAVARHMLARLGYQVTPFPDPAAALAAFRAAPADWDALLTDLNMPGMDGVSLAVALRKLRPALPVVVMTGRLDDLSRVRLRQAGIATAVAKPLSTSTLGQAVHEALAGAGAAGADPGGRRGGSGRIGS